MLLIGILSHFSHQSASRDQSHNYLFPVNNHQCPLSFLSLVFFRELWFKNWKRWRLVLLMSLHSVRALVDKCVAMQTTCSQFCSWKVCVIKPDISPVTNLLGWQNNPVNLQQVVFVLSVLLNQTVFTYRSFALRKPAETLCCTVAT